MANPSAESKIYESWQTNALPWIKAIARGEIESRLRVTNDAIVQAILARCPQTVLDLGCGEGWLTRRLIEAGINGMGVDATAALIQAAQALGAGTYEVMTYEAIAHGQLQRCFDGVVCNFSLFGESSVASLFQSIPSRLNPGGFLMVQTLHPQQICGEGPYQSGWRAGSWSGFSSEFCDPAPWYFRTIESWIELFRDSGFQEPIRQEPLDPLSHQPASLILTGYL